VKKTETPQTLDVIKHPNSMTSPISKTEHIYTQKKD
jgi:hypothetical protein